MMKILNIIYLIAIPPLFLLSSCKKEGKLALTPIKAVRPYDINGFVLGDTLEQYFDGVKVRDYYGKVSVGYGESALAFEKEEMNMQLKRKSTGETVFQQKFNIKDEKNIVPKFYFDGVKFSSGYNHPEPPEKEYIANFYLDAAKGSLAVDINIEVLEYYIDPVENKEVVINTTSFPIALNVKPGMWTDYIKIEIPPKLTPQRPDADFYSIVTIRNSKTKEYFLNNNRTESILPVEIPDEWTSTGKVQSIYFAKKAIAANKFYVENLDLISLFPRQ